MNHSNAANRIDGQRILQPKVIALLKKEGLHQVEDFAKLRTVCYEEADSASFYRHFRIFLVKSDIESVWQAYKTIHPKDTWRGNMVTFGCQYSRKLNKISYLDDEFEGLKPGQMLFMNLSLLGGLINIAVSHEIMEVNDYEHYIKICYLEKGAAQGSQWIRFFSTPEGFTRIEHETRYRSQSKFRDLVLYPPLHGLAVAEFHGHIRAMIERTT